MCASCLYLSCPLNVPRFIRTTMSFEKLRRRSSSRPRSKPTSPPQFSARLRWSSSTSWAVRLLRSSITRASFTSLNTPITLRCWHANKHGASQEGFSPECVERISLQSSRRAEGGGIMLVGGKSRFAKQVLGEERGVRGRREQGRRSTVDRNVQQSLHAAERSGRPGSRLHR